VGTSSSGSPTSIVSHNDGRSWTVGSMPSGFLPASPQGLSCSSVSVCVAVGITDGPASPPRGAALVTSDGGHHWKWGDVPSSVVRFKATTCIRALCMAIGNGPPADPSAPYGPTQTLASHDGGRRWVSYGQAGVRSAFLTSISCTPTTCWAAGALTKAATGTILSTTNGGQSWAPAELPGPPTRVQEAATRRTSIDVEGVTGISCPAVGSCIAIGSQGSAGSEQQIVLRANWGD
jgi:photosystem II stability/assembly factor-like uncharacterized protein